MVVLVAMATRTKLKTIVTNAPAPSLTGAGGKMTKAVPLRSLSKGGKGTIDEVSAEGNMGLRIREMGLVKGVTVEIIGQAPLKDPVALRLLGFTLTLRNQEADYITVIPQ